MSWTLFQFVHVVVFVLMVCLDGSGSTTPRVHVAGNETDWLALLAFKAQITGDPFGALNLWNEFVHFCQWAGVPCGCHHKRVTDWPSTKTANIETRLAGKIPVELGSLSLLKRLFIDFNKLIGEYGTGNEVTTLEMIIGKRPTDNMFNNLSLHNFVKMALPEQVKSIVDPTLFQRREIWEELPRDRPAINHAVTQLHVIKNNFLGTDGFVEEEELELQCDHK
ncbi:probable LRR receptor-like serine/threonine-protein kinase At3g47570 [Camellia sinensis]|uniref:probable LRR receptor-like serine/threonine-protein kinase At3g47570 n=1 Tax=Camellia sinensis TaxID=4442 RepID=UPI00103633AD|nr:probable LRR receptor-like serine/threonine-protein kinase At3g47570 [Camellia sinensis]